MEWSSVTPWSPPTIETTGDSNRFSEVVYHTKLTDRIISILIQMGKKPLSEDIRLTLRRELGTIQIMSLSKTRSKEEKSYRVLRARLESLNNQAHLARGEKGFDFTACHTQAFSTLLLRHCCTYNNRPFSFIKQSRARGFSLETVQTHIQDLLHLVPSLSWIDHLVVPLLGSALLFVHYPPGSPTFNPLLVFESFYAEMLCSIDALLTVQPAFKSELCDSIRRSLAKNFSQLTGKAPATAKEVHMQNLKKLHPYLGSILSNRSCFCCMHKAPELVLSCGHALCDTCLRAIGRRSAQEKHTFRIPMCVLCGLANDKVNIRLMPPTASVRLLSIDGGGIRGIIPLVFLKQLEEQLSAFQCPIADFFDFACGTSAGGLIIIGLFVTHWSASEGLAKFKNLATKIFGTKNANTMMIFRIHELILSYWRDAHYDSSKIENIFDEEMKPCSQMFNPLSRATKLAITTTDVKSVHPCLLTNYNGPRRDPGLGYTVLRARVAAGDPTISDAICSTSAAPWFFKPWKIKHLGTFQDGGLQYNNPLPLALSEMRHLWSDRSIPDIVLSIGTGSILDRCTAMTKQVADRFIVRLMRAFFGTMDGEKSWRELYNTLSGPMKSKFHRLNARIDISESAIDDCKAMEVLESKVTAQMSTTDFRSICDSLIASSFYFELDQSPTRKDGKLHCEGHIFCRLPLDLAGRRALYRELLIRKAWFLVQGCPIRCVEVLPYNSPSFKKSVKFTADDTSGIVGISILGITSKSHPISGFPRELKDLLMVQDLNNPFGRLDHFHDEKPLPRIPEKRKYSIL